ncbi:MAG TPA: helix-turn-helix domain-containing protein [Clostridia bacterium]|nr:helix-turn-helix domain-containing protein [Clostridia bacterium]
MTPAVYTVLEVAALLDINVPSAYELARRPDFPAIRVSPRRIIIPRDAFHRWLEQAALDCQSCGKAQSL